MTEPPRDISRYWKTVLDTMLDALLVMSPRGEILTVNRAAEEITGYSAAELVGSPCSVLGCTGCALYGKGPGPQWCQLYNDGSVASKRCQIVNKRGERVHVIKKATVLRDESGEIMGAVEALNDITEVVLREKEIISLRRSLAGEDGFHGIIGHAPPMRRLFALIENAARSEAPVLVQGESGTGKELVAQAIHQVGPRSQGPFVKVNCAALNQNLLESELFGHVKGAFTGAERDRTGRFQAAHGGDIFLDEIGDLPLATQVKLLRVLEEKEVERVGDNKPIKVDVRIITATNRDLGELMAGGRFRQDLFYRINVVPMVVPPLRERAEDVTPLAQAFVEGLCLRTGRPIEGFSPPALEALGRYHWPGNVRELKNAIEYAFVLCRDGLIRRRHLPEHIAGSPPAQARGRTGRGDQRQELIQALRQAGGNQTQAARLLGVSRMTVWKRMKKHGVNLKTDIA